MGRGGEQVALPESYLVFAYLGKREKKEERPVQIVIFL
jgi:hypothetical protein